MMDELTPREAAERLGATTRSVQRWIARGELPARRVGGRWRVASDVLDAFGASNGQARAEPGPFAPTVRDIAFPAAATVVPIRTLFIANRGEIAVRIRRTADRLGIRVVAPGTDGRPPVDLLSIPAIVAAAIGSGADALHPGFGFLSENAAFADAVEAGGMRWVGPPPNAIRAMGDKASARHLARDLGIPIVPGYDGDDQSDAALVEAARAIAGHGSSGRHAVLIKPAAGGGGKGMRVVESLESLDSFAGAFAEALAGARREALAAFGDDRLILERYLTGPRHVEVQLLFDAHGAGVHLGERDCSLQRRHQKVFEESPSPAVDEPLRQRLGVAALALASAVGYRSAGTCEFLLDDGGEFHFLEMNTRLQVEHPVTELISGRDLVADQLRIAAGEPLGFDQAGADRARRAGGHAIEVRLYAEDPDAGFLPSTGRVEALRWPPAVRVDSGIEVGSQVDTHFDPMLAKIIVGGRTRRAALATLRTALAETVVLGLVTNLEFLRWLAAQSVVTAGEARIDTLEAIWPPADAGRRGARGSAAAPTAPSDPAWQAAARVLARRTAGGWRLNGPALIRLESDALERTVLLDGSPDGPADSESMPLAILGARGVAFVDDDGRSRSFRLAPPPDVDRAARAAAGPDGGPIDVASPMPGAVLAIHVIRGAAVEAGQPLVTIEAMKMEHVVTAVAAGVVNDVLVQRGDQVSRGQALVALVALTAGAGRATVAAEDVDAPEEIP